MSAEPVAPVAPPGVLPEGAALSLGAAAAAPASPGAPRRARHPLLDTGRPLGRAVRLALVLSALAAAVALGIPLCPFAIITRHPCPGCGLTRATLALAHGHVHEAARFHPLVFVVTPVIAVAFAYNAFGYVRWGEWFRSERLQGRFVTGAWIALGAVMLALWIARFFGAFGGPVPV